MGQRNFKKFCAKNEIKCVRTFGKSTISRTRVQLWYNRFKEGRDLNNDASPGRLSTSTTDENIKAVKKMILNNRRITVREARLLMMLAYHSAHVKQFLRMF